MGGADDEVQIATGKSPEGVAVTYFEVDRPETVGGQSGKSGYLVEVRGPDGKRITHSDTLAGLKSAGYTVDEPKPAIPAPVKPPVPVAKPAAPKLADSKPVAAKSIEDELGAAA